MLLGSFCNRHRVARGPRCALFRTRRARSARLLIFLYRHPAKLRRNLAVCVLSSVILSWWQRWQAVTIATFLLLWVAQATLPHFYAFRLPADALVLLLKHFGVARGAAAAAAVAVTFTTAVLVRPNALRVVGEIFGFIVSNRLAVVHPRFQVFG